MGRRKGGGRGVVGARAYPLRRVVNPRATHPVHTSLPAEELECGHIIVQPSDIFGHTNAARRRCRKCAKGMPADVQTSTEANNG